MSGVKHTPGPWNTFQTNGKGVETPGGVTHWVKAGEGYGHVGDGFLSVCIGGSRDAEANARLIAAAPDFFDHAKSLVEAWDARTTGAQQIITGKSDRELQKQAMDAIDGLRAAIARARGEQSQSEKEVGNG